MINDENWTYFYYKTLSLKAFISFGGEKAQDNETSFLYFVTVSDHNHKEVFQSSHKDLDLALAEINRKYGHFELVDATKSISEEGDGCSTCSAH